MSIEQTVKALLEKETEEGKVHHEFFKGIGFNKGKGVFHPLSFQKIHDSNDDAISSKDAINKHLESRGYKKAAKTFAHDVYRHPVTKKEVVVNHDKRYNLISVEADK